MLFLAAVAALAQYPGQYPPGQYPPGRYPGQYPPGPAPRIPGQTGPAGRPPQPGGRTPRSTTSRDKNAPLVTTTTGIFRRTSANQLVIEADDHRIIWYRLGDKLAVRQQGKDADLASFAPGDYLSVDSTSDDDGNFTAVSVSWQKEATPADRAAAQKQWDLPRAMTATAERASTPARAPGDDRPILRRKNPEPEAAPETKKTEPAETAAAPPPPEDLDTRPTTTVRPRDPTPEDDDPGRPVLRRGAPAPRRPPVRASAGPGASTGNGPVILSKTPDPAPAAAADAPILPQDDPVILKAREAGAAYASSLPNFFAQQMTTRYQSDRPKQGWQALDVVTADVAYEDGRESYKNIKVGSKTVNKAMEEIGGTRSTGEFATLVESLLEPGARATFRRSGQETIRNRPAWVYNFEIPRELSRWRVEAPSQLYYPAIRGSIWIDKESSRILRIEQQGRNLPALFPFDTVETSADYDFIRLGTAGPFLLPVEAEVLSCQRGTSLCSRNRLEFRNYRKFGAESDVSFGDEKQ